MSRATWIDLASDWFANLVPPDFLGDSKVFTPEQTRILHAAFKDCFMSFAKEVGSTLGDKINEIRLEMQQQMKDVEKSRTSRCEEATGMRAAINIEGPNRKKNLARKSRRLRVKQKYTIQRTQLLQLRPASELLPEPKLQGAYVGSFAL